jgi:formate hydrogenlyase subunit 3/multisubunit Na+/H+ antiporter MnhD subunit
MSDSVCPPFSQGSTNWLIFLSLIPNNVVQVGAIILSAIITAARLLNAYRATSLNTRIEVALCDVEADICDAVERRLLKVSDACGAFTVEDALRT